MTLVSPSIVSEQVHIIRVKLKWKIVYGIIAVALSFLYGWLITLPFIEGRTNDITFVITFIIFGGIGLTLIAYSCLSLYNARIELYHDKIRDINLFGTKELFVKDIEGFRILSTQYAKILVLIPRNSSSKKMKFSVSGERDDEFMEWIKNKLVDLDAADFQAEARQIENDPGLGETREDRLCLVDKARKCAWLINSACFIVSIWGMFWPRPYNLVIFLLVMVPLAALVSLRFLKGVLKVNAKEKSAYPTIAGSLILPGIALVIRATDWKILAWDNFWTPFVAATIFLMIIVFIFTHYEKKTISYSAGLLLICPIYASGGIVVLNAVSDTSIQSEYKATITDKSMTSGKYRSYTLDTYTPDFEFHEISIKVNKRTYDQHNVGDEMKLIVRKGMFGMPWCSLTEQECSSDM